MALPDEHIQELLKLPVHERVRAAKLLLDSIHEGTDVEALLAAERARRADGSADLLDAEDLRLRSTTPLRKVRAPKAL
jgi:hypothetical protein